MTYLQDIAAKVVSEGIENTLYQTKDSGPLDWATNKNYEDHYYFVKEEGSHIYRRRERMWVREDIFQAATVNPELLIHYGQLTGHAFMPMLDSFVCKIPEGNVPVL